MPRNIASDPATPQPCSAEEGIGPYLSSPAESRNESPSFVEDGSRFLDRYAIPLLFAFSLLLYIVTTGYELVGDDAILIGGNPYVRSFHFLREIFTQTFWAFRGARGDSMYYRPLIMFSFLLQSMLFGARPAPFHLLNVLLNSWVVVMVYQLGRKLWPKGRGALWAALIFAVLPVHSEDVATVSGISDVECAAFFLAALLIYTQPARGGGYSRVRAWMSALVFLLAALCKEVALAVPVLMVLYEHFLRGDTGVRFGERLSRYMPTFLLSAFYLVVHLAVIGDLTTIGPPHRMRLRETLVFGFTQLGGYVGKLIWPQHLSYSWKFYPPLSWRDPAVLLGMLFTLWAVGTALAWWKRDRPVTFSIVWFFLTLAPVLNIAGVGVPAYGERYLYIPSVGICWLAGQALVAVAGQGASRIAWRRVAAATLGSAVLVAGAVRTCVHLPIWRNNFTLGQATVIEDPAAAMFHVYNGNHYREVGDRNNARTEFIAAIATDPRAGEAFVNLAGVFLDDGNQSAAEAILRRGAQLNPNFSKPLYVLGKLALDRNSKDEARDLFNRALALDPNDAEALFQLGLLSLEEGKLADAEKLLSHTATVEPASALVHLNLGAVFSREKKFGAAEAEFQNAILLAPGNEGPYLALAGVYEDQGKQMAALELYQRIVRAAPDSPTAQFRRGVLALKMGKRDEAIAALERAMAIQPKSPLAHVQLGLAYLDSGNAAHAQRELETAKALDPEDETVQAALKKLKSYPKSGPLGRDQHDK